MHNWDDYRFAAAVAESGTVRGAARELGVNPSTVTRRLEQFEARLGVRLFNRSSSGIAPTQEGQQLIAALGDVAAQLRDVEEGMLSDAQSLRGEVRIAVSPALQASVVMPALAELRAAHLDLGLRWTAAWDARSLETRDVDIALMALAEPPVDLVGRTAGELLLAAFAAPAVAADWPAGPWLPSALQQASAPNLAIEGVPSWGWFATLEAQLAAAQAGLGATLLPVQLVQADARLVELPVARIRVDVWLLSHPEARGVRRVQAVAAALLAQLRGATAS